MSTRESMDGFDPQWKMGVGTWEFPTCICIPDREDVNGGLRDDCPLHGDPAIRGGDVVERAKATLEGVTEEPWNAIEIGRSRWGVGHRDNNFPTVVKAESASDGHSYGSSHADAVFIAAARTLVPELIAEVERLRGATR